MRANEIKSKFPVASAVFFHWLRIMWRPSMVVGNFIREKSCFSASFISNSVFSPWNITGSNLYGVPGEGNVYCFAPHGTVDDFPEQLKKYQSSHHHLWLKTWKTRISTFQPHPADSLTMIVREEDQIEITDYQVCVHRQKYWHQHHRN